MFDSIRPYYLHVPIPRLLWCSSVNMAVDVEHQQHPEPRPLDQHSSGLPWQPSLQTPRPSSLKRNKPCCRLIPVQVHHHRGHRCALFQADDRLDGCAKGHKIHTNQTAFRAAACGLLRRGPVGKLGWQKNCLANGGRNPEISHGARLGVFILRHEELCDALPVL